MGAISGLLLNPASVLAQQTSRGAPVSQAVVQQLPSSEALQLNAALSKLARNPRDVNALIEAGAAASDMRDYEAAVGFYRRAEQISGGDARVKAGLASALLNDGDPYSALPLFAEAEKAGANPTVLAAERGLAHDLVGNFSTAQGLYRKALASRDDPEIRRRLALSQAIGGDQRGFEATLLPLLRQQDKAAWRTRAFGLAILGRIEEAVKVTGTILPTGLAENLAPYLRYMPRLTAAQQAAAANLGKFPHASEIGRDDPRVAQYSDGSRRGIRVASVGASLVPQGRPLGDGTKTASRSVRESREQRQAQQEEKRKQRAEERAERLAVRQAPRVAPPEPKPERQSSPDIAPAVVATAKPEPAAPVVTPTAELPPTPAPALAKPAAAQPKPVQIASAVTPKQVNLQTGNEVAVTSGAGTSGGVRPGFDLAKLPNSTGPSSSVSVAATLDMATPGAAPADKPADMSLSDIFSDLGRPSTDITPIAGAVDIRKIEPARPKPPAVVAEPPKPPPPSHPSRIWVQLGIGQNKSALSYDWRRMSRRLPALFGGQRGYVSDMGQTNRMLAGPFETQRAANAFIAGLKDGGIDGPYIWTSPAGQVVDAL